jgi:hypothetical protein
MALPVVTGAMISCSFGTAPGTLNVLPVKKVMLESKPAATIMDNKPFVNITPFATCMSLANPTTASLTAAALGVLTPGPCVPAIPAPWVPGAPTVLVGNEPMLNNSSQCMCAYGGVITVGVPGATTEMIP